MNKLEEKYSKYLDTLMVAGEIVWYKFEGLKFRLADKTFYTPDFIVMRKDGQLEAHETKGFWEDDARVKIKVAASLYPFQFIGVKSNGKLWNAWQFEEF